MTPEEALLHIRYTGWASRRLPDAAPQLSPEILSKDLSVPHTSILGTLAHNFWEWEGWAPTLSDADLEQIIAYRLRQAGAPPPATDLIFYHRDPT